MSSGLSEVDQPASFERAMEQKWPGRYRFIRGLTGINEDREDDHLWIAFDSEKFALVNSEEMTELGGFVFDDGHHRVPLYARLRDKMNGQEVVFLMNHLARRQAVSSGSSPDVARMGQDQIDTDRLHRRLQSRFRICDRTRQSGI